MIPLTFASGLMTSPLFRNTCGCKVNLYLVSRNRSAVLAESLNENNSLDLEQLRAWAKEHFAPYKILRRLQVLDDLPRHAVPKVK